jgi:hypothetical protein
VDGAVLTRTQPSKFDSPSRGRKPSLVSSAIKVRHGVASENKATMSNEILMGSSSEASILCGFDCPIVSAKERIS